MFSRFLCEPTLAIFSGNVDKHGQLGRLPCWPGQHGSNGSLVAVADMLALVQLWVLIPANTDLKPEVRF